MFIILEFQWEYIHGFEDEKTANLAKDNALYGALIYVGCTVIATISYFYRLAKENSTNLTKPLEQPGLELVEDLSAPLIDDQLNSQSGVIKPVTSNKDDIIDDNIDNDIVIT